MISVLIPVFNRNVVPLITSLHNQLQAINEKAEIVVMDDASTDDVLKNANSQSLSKLAAVNYIALPHNAGRNIIRHKLAEAAKYDTFIFLDADSDFVDDQWLQRYIAAVANETIIMGGRLYKIDASNNALHFQYGTQREQRKAIIRNKHPYRSFLACNFLIHRKQLASLIIDNHLHGYCHEDTFMGLQFEKLGVPIMHIDNPVYHEGIDEDNVFMDKQREALENLRYLYLEYGSRFNFTKDVKLIKIYQKLATSRMGNYLLDKMSVQSGDFKKRVLKSHSLFWLDCWKLATYHNLTKA